MKKIVFYSFIGCALAGCFCGIEAFDAVSIVKNGFMSLATKLVVNQTKMKIQRIINTRKEKARIADTAGINLPEKITRAINIAPSTVPEVIRERIELLRRKQYTGHACKPILLAGAPGTGKTELCKYLAHQSDSPLLYSSAAGIMGGKRNSGVEHIYHTFRHAQYQPNMSWLRLKLSQLKAWVLKKPIPARKLPIILLDEIDAIAAPVDESQLNEGDRVLETERRNTFERLKWEISQNPYIRHNFNAGGLTMPAATTEDKSGNFILRLYIKAYMALAKSGLYIGKRFNLASPQAVDAMNKFEQLGKIMGAAGSGLANSDVRRALEEALGKRGTDTMQNIVDVLTGQELDFMKYAGFLVHEMKNEFFYTDKTRQPTPIGQFFRTARDNLMKAPRYLRPLIKAYFLPMKLELCETDTDALVVATTNMSVDRLQAIPQLSEFFEIVSMDPLTQAQRLDVLQLHAQGKTIADKQEVLEQLSRVTEGYSGSELEAVINDAALIAAERNADTIEQHDLQQLLDSRLQQAPPSQTI